jgi:hypothetical protein
MVDVVGQLARRVLKALGHAACARALSVYYASMAEVLQTSTPLAQRGQEFIYTAGKCSLSVAG